MADQAALDTEVYERGLAGGDPIGVLREQRDRLATALAALLDHAERIQEHVPKSENWYAVRDCARNALEGRGSGS